MVNIIKMANDRPMEIHDLFVAGMKVKQSQLSADSAYFLMHIILDPDIQPEMFKQMFRGVLTKNNIYHTPEEAFESINSGEVFVFLSKQGPIYMSRIDLANGITNFMSEHYEREDYKVYEEDVNGYTAQASVQESKDGFEVTLTNTHTVESVSVPVQKVWQDNNNLNGRRPHSVTIYLYANGEYTGSTLVLRSRDNWAGSFENLPKYSNGQLINYTVREKSVYFYNGKVSANPNGGWRGQADPRQGGWNGPQGGPGGPFPYSRYAPPFAGIDMNEEIDGISVKEYAAMVGPNAPYYITRFKAMASRRVVSWNWGAFFFNFLYFFYRKMYAIGALLAVLFVTSLLPTFLFTWEYLQELVASGAAMSFPLPQIYTPHMDQLMLMQSFLRTLWFVVMILCGLWANRLYFSAVKNTILKIRQDPRSQDVSFYIRALSARGGISKGAVLLVVGILFLAYMTFSYVVGMTILG